MLFMGMKFRKSVKIAPGVRVNFNKKSVGLSVGGKGARVSVNSSGRVTKTVSLPGTGLSYSDSHTIGGGSKRSTSAASAGADQRYDDDVRLPDAEQETQQPSRPSGLRTGADMAGYVCINHLSQASRAKDLKNFNLIAAHLGGDETVYLAFSGMFQFVSFSVNKGTYAYALTNKRLILAQKKMLGGIVQEIKLDNLYSVEYTSKSLIGLITLHTASGALKVGLNRETALNIYKKLNPILHTLKNPPSPEPEEIDDTPTPSDTSSTPTADVSTVQDQLDALRDLKDLLDDGAITQAEFDRKKQEILGL